MKRNRLSLLFVLIVVSLFLTACTGAIGASSWPGITASDEIVYAAYGPNILAVRANNGNLVWKYPAEGDARVNFYARPAVTEDLVIAGDYANTLHALRRGTGEPAWTFPGAKGRYIASPLVIEDRVYAANNDGSLYVLDLQGSLQWKFTAEQGLWAQPATDGETLYLPSMDHNFYAISMADGSELWSVDMGGASVAAPAVSDDGSTVYVGTLTNELIAFDAASGQVLWRARTEDAIWATPVWSDSTVYIGDLSGTAYAIGMENGNIAWQTKLDTGIIGSAAVTGEGVVFTTETGIIQGLGFEGDKQWNATINGKLYTSPVVLEDRIVTGIVGGESLLVAYDFNGTELWTYVPAD